jgi:hypothetical protein
LNEEEKGNLKNLENENKQLLDLRDENGGWRVGIYGSKRWWKHNFSS